jgi:hypothetical protein
MTGSGSTAIRIGARMEQKPAARQGEREGGADERHRRPGAHAIRMKPLFYLVPHPIASGPAYGRS